MKDKLTEKHEISILTDFYGDVLTERHLDFLRLYYQEDFSLAEIAEQKGISRQGVLDGIKKAREKLVDIEDKLQLYARSRTLQDDMVYVLKRIEDIQRETGADASDIINKLEKLLGEL